MAEQRSFNERLRDRFFGRTPGGSDEQTEQPEPDGPAGLSAAPRGSGVSEMGFFGRVPRPGGFDAPPEEPIELEGPLPWELGGPRTESADGEPEDDSRS
jgi:hypothetical protein